MTAIAFTMLLYIGIPYSLYRSAFMYVLNGGQRGRGGEGVKGDEEVRKSYRRRTRGRRRMKGKRREIEE